MAVRGNTFILSPTPEHRDDPYGSVFKSNGTDHIRRLVSEKLEAPSSGNVTIQVMGFLARPSRQIIGTASLASS